MLNHIKLSTILHKCNLSILIKIIKNIHLFKGLRKADTIEERFMHPIIAKWIILAPSKVIEKENYESPAVQVSMKCIMTFLTS